MSAPDPLETDETTLKLDHHFSPRARWQSSYFFLKGTDTQPLSRPRSGNIPWVDRDFKWTQHNLNMADTWIAEPDDDQPAALHLHAAVRRPREQCRRRRSAT